MEEVCSYENFLSELRSGDVSHFLSIGYLDELENSKVRNFDDAERALEFYSNSKADGGKTILFNYRTVTKENWYFSEILKISENDLKFIFDVDTEMRLKDLASEKLANRFFGVNQ